MALASKMSNAAAIAACNAIVDLLDAGSGPGTVKIYTGSGPTNVDDAATGTLLGTLTCSDPAFGNAVDGTGKATATASAVTSDSSADASGTAGYFRALDSTGTAVIQGSCGTSSADMILDTVSILAGGTISITSWTISVSEGA